jgi:hypothetical protein
MSPIRLLVVSLAAACVTVFAATGDGVFAQESSSAASATLRAEWGRGVERPSTYLHDGGSSAFAPLRLVRTDPVVRPRIAPADADAQVDVVLWNGDRVQGRFVAGADDALTVAIGASASVVVPIDALASCTHPARRVIAGAEELAAPAQGDRLYRRAGSGVDVVDGTLDGLSNEGVAFESRLGRRVHPWSEVVALFVEVIDPPEASRGTPQSVVVDLVGGTRLSGRVERIDAATVALALPWGESIAFATSDVALVGADDGRITYLSDLEPAAVSGGSAFDDDLGLVFAPARDRAVHGAALVCGGRTWPRGVGVQSPTTIVHQLEPGRQSRFCGFVGIDDSTAELAARGAAEFVVRGDGSELWRSGVVRGGDAPIALPTLDVSKLTRLELVVEMGPDLNLGDRADWLDLWFER